MWKKIKCFYLCFDRVPEWILQRNKSLTILNWFSKTKVSTDKRRMRDEHGERERERGGG